jgi:hypothetical protein
VHASAAVQPVPIGTIARWSWLPFVALLSLYVVAFDSGALTQTGSLLHELMHDGRHLLGVPCH